MTFATLQCYIIYIYNHLGDYSTIKLNGSNISSLRFGCILTNIDNCTKHPNIDSSSGFVNPQGLMCECLWFYCVFISQSITYINWLSKIDEDINWLSKSSLISSIKLVMSLCLSTVSEIDDHLRNNFFYNPLFYFIILF